MLFLLPVLTGFLLSLSFPRINQGYLAWVAFIPLIIFIFKTKSLSQAFGGGFVTGGLYFFSLLIWMPPVLIRFGELSGPLAWAAYGLLICLLACYPAAACALTKYVVKKCGNSFILFFPVIWVSIEYLFSFSPFGGFPWLLSGYTQSRFIALIQIADITGVYGISFLVLYVGTALAWIYLQRSRGFRAFIPAAAVCVLVFSCLIYGRLSLAHWGNGSPSVKVAMLQGNIASDDPEQVTIDKLQTGYVRMAHRIESSSDLLLLPESPTPLSFDGDSSFSHSLRNLAQRYPLGLVFNNVSRRKTANAYRFYNSAYFLNRNGTVAGVYDKIHLVPFGEYIPFQRVFSFAETITKDVGSFDPGTDYKLVNMDGNQVNSIICFEAVFPDLVRRFVQKGSRLIINLTNDGWYGDSAAPYQHLEIARLRAVENRRYLLRAANSGISAVIEPTGKIQKSTGILQEAICQGSFEFISYKTIYTRYGDFFVFLCVIISCWLMVLAIFYKR
jgi:apolipoprotein N-acyltransferase